jgi:hypothetical protein
MNKNLMFYGLVALGGVLAYYAWKKHSLSAKQNSESTTTPLSHTSGVFVDDVPVDPSMLGIKTGGIKENFTSAFDTVKTSVSQIIEPIVGTSKSTQLSGQGQFIES